MKYYINKIKSEIMYKLISLGFIDYFEIYRFLYDKINSRKLSSKKVLKVQESIFGIIEFLKRDMEKYNHVSFYNYDYLIEVFRMLVNNILNVYVIDADIVVNRNLTMKQYGNDNYESQNIKHYFIEAKEILKSNKNAFIVINDLCMGNIDWGDIIYRCNNEVKFKELKKPTKKNIEMMNALDLYELNPFIDKHDRKQFDRLKKQAEKHKRITENLQSFVWFGEDGESGITLPYSLDNIDTFSDFFLKILDGADKQLIKEYIIDDCITVCSIDLRMYELLYNEDEEPCSICKYLSNKRDYLMNESDILKTFKLMSEPPNDYNRFLYNDILQEAFMPQPYLIGVKGDVIKKIIRGEIAIFIMIDIDKLFEVIRKNGYKIYSKKGVKTNKSLYYKNKNWMISNGKTTGSFGLSLIHRLAYNFYTTNGLIEFLNVYLFPTIEVSQNQQ